VQRDLVEAARHGDHEAFEVLAASAGDRLFAIARLILRDTHLAEDAVQEALVHAWRHLPTLRDPQPWDAWLHRLIVNACADQRRRLQLRRRVVLHFYLGLPVPEVADALGVPLGTAKSRIHYAVEAMRAALEADERASIATTGGLAG
jgi:DNA-directed RNA polymerase specialized sigma24 family protein